MKEKYKTVWAKKASILEGLNSYNLPSWCFVVKDKNYKDPLMIPNFGFKSDGSILTCKEERNGAKSVRPKKEWLGKEVENSINFHLENNKHSKIEATVFRRRGYNNIGIMTTGR